MLKGQTTENERQKTENVEKDRSSAINHRGPRGRQQTTHNRKHTTRDTRHIPHYERQETYTAHITLHMAHNKRLSTLTEQTKHNTTQRTRRQSLCPCFVFLLSCLTVRVHRAIYHLFQFGSES